MSEQQANQGWKEAVRRIEKAKRTNATSLNLRERKLTAIPDSLAQLTDLQELYLGNNRITAIPNSLAQLANLQVLDLSNNRITAIPDSLAQLTDLQELYLNHNQIAATPASLGQLASLKRLDLGNNKITTISASLAQLANLQVLNLSYNQIAATPASLGQLASLKRLDLSNNKITTISASLAQLANLQVLDLSNNQITATPGSLGQLANLKGLYIHNNQITAMPDSLSQLANLKELSLNNNQITAIPDSLAQLANLQIVLLSNNQIITIPDSLSQLAGLQVLSLNNNRITAISDSLAQLANLKVLELDGNPLPDELLAALESGLPSFFRYLQATAKRKEYPRTVKLVLLGEPKSGKTTLLEALKGNPQPCDDSRPETLGVNVVSIEKPHPGDRQPMRLSAWDFAGQHIEHATHQFFLTENAIYLILWNARLGAEFGKRDLWYWLELLKMRVREPKFLLVATHTQRTPPDLNLSEIERSYSGCQGHFPIELRTLEGVAALEKRILELAAASPSFRAEWPPERLAVRDAVRAVRQKQPYMTPAAFSALMKNNGVTEPETQQDLASQLHYLGEILYFQERDELSSLVILDPEWVTELIALVVRSKEVREHKGILHQADLDTLWAKASLQPEVRDHLIRLMDWFDLTCSTGHRTEMGMVVEALPYSTPEGRGQIELASGRPQTEMIFRFPSLQRHLPPGIPTWAIARAHRFLKPKHAPWRDAAAFADENTKSEAVILASDAAKEVRLRVASDYPPFFFGQLQAILLDTFKRYPGAEPERRLPCPCQPECPNSYPYEMVVKRQQHRWPYVTCEKSGDDVAVAILLSGVKPPDTDTAEGQRALLSEMRRQFTAQRHAQNEQMKKNCPSVFTLVPSRDFKLLDTWLESVTMGEELELALYCEHDSEWHDTAQSVYRFKPDQEWFDLLKKSWNQLVTFTRYVGPLAKALGKASKLVALEVTGMATEKLPEVSRSIAGPLSVALRGKDQPESIDIEVRYLLERLIGYLDSQRSATEPKNGGLHRHIIDDGRLLWLCPEHLKLHQGREFAGPSRG